MSSPPLGSIFRGVYNASDADMAKLELSTAYLDMAAEGNQLISDVSVKNVSVSINHEGKVDFELNPNTGEMVITWDPDKAIEVRDSTGQVIGYESAAANLAHEMAHAADPNFVANTKIAVVGFDTMAEKVAIDRVNSFITGLGEPPRIAHDGDLVQVPNPTLHTDNGLWEEVDSNGIPESSDNYHNFSDNWTTSPFTYAPDEPIGDPYWDNGSWDFYGYYAATNGKVDSNPPPSNLKKLATVRDESVVGDTANRGRAMSKLHVEALTAAGMHLSTTGVSSAVIDSHAAGLIQAMSSFASGSGAIEANFSNQSQPGWQGLHSSALFHASHRLR